VNRRRTVALVALVLGATAALAWARPGGGDSYSGGGGHGGGGSGGSGGSGDAAVLFELIYQLLRLCFHYPKIGLPIVAILIGAWIWGAWVKHKNKDWLSGPPVELAKPIATADDLRRLDPDFSMIVFEDFVYRLYATAHGARGRRGALDAPRAVPRPRGARRPGQPTPDRSAGHRRGGRRDAHLRCVGADPRPARRRGRSAVPHRRRVRGQLHRRHQQAVRGRALAPASSRDRADQAAERGPDLHLPELRRAVGHRRRRRRPALRVVRRGRRQRPLRLGGRGHRAAPRAQQPARPDRRGAGARHVLADLPRRPGRRRLAAPDRRRSGDRRDLALGPPASRLPVVNDAWTAGDVAAIRTVTTDGMADYLSYWLDAYRAAGLRNVLEDMRITHQVPAKITRDRYYDAITIRIWGTGKDYVVGADGSHVRGSRHRERAYSEYWTLVRSAARRGPPRADGACSNCGAPLTITAAGACGHCGTHVTAGEFDWVLSKIEQDDSYRG
jgi:predicted lipid-binding transport protein (Tim44 family)